MATKLSKLTYNGTWLSEEAEKQALIFGLETKITNTKPTLK